MVCVDAAYSTKIVISDFCIELIQTQMLKPLDYRSVGTLNQIAGKKKDPMTTNKSKDAKLENKGVSEPSATELDDQKNAKEVTQMAEAIAKALNEAVVRDYPTVV